MQQQMQDVTVVRALLAEIKEAMEALVATGKTHTIYMNSTGLTEEQIVEVLETLGEGDVFIDYKETDQPVRWYETRFRGVWAGVYRNSKDEAMLYTIEVAHYPEVAGAYAEDVSESALELQEWIEDTDI